VRKSLLFLVLVACGGNRSDVATSTTPELEWPDAGVVESASPPADAKQERKSPAVAPPSPDAAP
jgi:hypothetical protein